MTDELDLCPGCFLEPRTDACPRCTYRHDPDAFPTALRPGTGLSKYALGRVLGKPGGFGITYLAFDPVLHRRVAIKELMPRELVARRPDGVTVHVQTREDSETFKYTLTSFLNEARLLAQFSHPNVVRVLDYFEANGTAYFAMDYYEGQTLAEYAHRAGGRLAGPDAVRVMLPLLDALDHIHSLPEPILHRDIKPANIYLTGRQTPILLDFGAARVAMGQQSRSLSAVLTPGYAPYEQYSTRGKQGPWSDVYACAATLHYLVTGRVPADASERIDDPVIESPRTYAPDLPQALSDAIVYGLGFKPEQRPQSARAFADLIAGRQSAPLAATHVVTSLSGAGGPGASQPGEMPRTLIEPTVRRDDHATSIAPPSVAAWAPPLPQHPPPAPPLPSASSPSRRSPNRMPLLAAAAALVLVVSTAWGVGLFQQAEDTSAGDAAGSVAPKEEPAPPTGGAATDRSLQTDEPSPPAVNEPPAAAEVPTPAPADRTAKPPVPDRSAPPAAAGAQDPAPPPPAAAPPTGVLVVIRGDDADGVIRAETSILRSLVGRNGLEALDADSLSMLTGNQSALQAAVQGNFAELAAIGRPHGVELMVVGELRARAVPSINRFFTGTAELTVRMYRVSNSRLVDTQTFIVGPGGAQPVLAISEGDARSRAASQAASTAADEVGSWLGRAF
jgi:serine/threonine protein kinase